MKEIIKTLSLVGLCLASTEALAAPLTFKFESKCYVSQLKSDTTTRMTELNFFVRSQSSNYMELLSCGGGTCVSSRVYVNPDGFVFNTHKYIGQILSEKLEKDSYEIIYEGSDAGHSRKINLNTKTGELILYEYGKTILKKKDFHEEHKAKCDSIKVNNL